MKIYNIEIQSVTDYLYLEQKVKDYHDDMVSALLNKFGKKSHPSSVGGMNCPQGNT